MKVFSEIFSYLTGIVFQMSRRYVKINEIFKFKNLNLKKIIKNLIFLG